MARDEEFVERLSQYRQALEEEYATLKGVTDPADIHEAVRKVLVKSLPTYVERLDALAKGAESEAVQLSALKFIHTIITRVDTVESQELRELLRELTGDRES